MHELQEKSWKAQVADVTLYAVDSHSDLEQLLKCAKHVVSAPPASCFTYSVPCLNSEDGRRSERSQTMVTDSVRDLALTLNEDVVLHP